MQKIKHGLLWGLKAVASCLTLLAMTEWSPLLGFYWPAHRIVAKVSIPFYSGRWGEMVVFMACATLALTACLYRGLFPKKEEKHAAVFLILVILIYAAIRICWRYWRETTVSF